MKKIFALAMSAALILSGCSSNAPTILRSQAPLFQQLLPLGNITLQ